MNFTRRKISPVSSEFLRIVAARSGFLLDSPDCIRVGLGDVVDTLHLPNGTSGASDVTSFFSGHTLRGERGPVGTGIVAMGSLPFDRSTPTSLSLCAITITQFPTGETFATTVDGAPHLESLLSAIQMPTQGLQERSDVQYSPTGEKYAQTVAAAVEDLRAGRLTKVVLARSVRGQTANDIDPAAVALRLRRREPLCTIYAMPLPDGRRFVGASPELLVARSGNDVACHPLAGTIAVPPDIDPDSYHNWLLGSSKNLHEHAVLASEVIAALAPHYSVIDADPSPSIVTLHSVAHLGTWIRGSASAGAPSALELLTLLHPTAAVGGLPRREAYETIQRLEPSARGHYAGPVGWVDDQGDGEWWIGIRGVLIHSNTFEAWAGAGIVSESDPIAEREETREKLQSVLSAVLAEDI